MPAPAGFVQSLVDYAEAIEDVTPLEEERDALFLRIKSGEGGALITATINGKTFGFQGNMTVEEKFTAFVQAVKEYNGTAVHMTYADFSGIVR